MLNRMPRRLAILISLLMVLAGLALIVWLLARVPTASQAAREAQYLPTDAPRVELTIPVTPTAVVAQSGQDRPLPVPSPTPVAPVVLGLSAGLPGGLTEAAQRLAAEDPALLLALSTAPTTTLRLDWQPSGEAVYGEVYALAVRFDTIFPQTESKLVQDVWQGHADAGVVFQRIAVLSDTLPALVSLLGEVGAPVHAVASVNELVDAAWADGTTLVLLPFAQLTPELVVLAVDGQNPVDNRFESADYPFVATVYAHSINGTDDKAMVERLAAISGGTNRDPKRLTVLAMTGVTAMVRQTAAQMDLLGPEWVADVVGPELAAADITAVSNEVPFVPGCVTNTSAENLTFCSPPAYMAALEGVGADIIGLTGNHQNDYGRADALVSLDIHAEAGLPVYGGGRNKVEAFAPLYIEHNGNRLAFLGANSYGPDFAWATDDGPGSAEFDLNILSATIRAVKEQDKADVVLVELQYQESYGVDPLWDQRQNFRLLSETGADIVTGIQSHVPQAIEFDDGRLILYGLGNLFFDQMWRQDTREGLIVKHTFYAGRHISTQILTTLLYDFGQPRWSSEEERASLLQRVFDASYWPRLNQP